MMIAKLTNRLIRNKKKSPVSERLFVPAVH